MIALLAFLSIVPALPLKPPPFAHARWLARTGHYDEAAAVADRALTKQLQGLPARDPRFYDAVYQWTFALFDRGLRLLLSRSTTWHSSLNVRPRAERFGLLDLA